MQGLHLTADLRGCSPTQAALTEPARLRELCLRAVRKAGLQPVGELFHHFAPALPLIAVGFERGERGAVARVGVKGAVQRGVRLVVMFVSFEEVCGA